MREDEKKCVRCHRKFKSGEQLLSVYEFVVHEPKDREFVTQTMHYVHLECEAF